MGIRLTVPAALAIVGGLSRPAKMPCPAWGISARECGRGRELVGVAGSVCSRCYALRGRYVTGSVATAHRRRLEALDDPLWPEAMASLIDAYCRGGYFRWFDSGDLQSIKHLDQILWVAKKTASVRHWLPTHEVKMAVELKHHRPPNMTMRLSAAMIDTPPQPTGGLPTATVHTRAGEPVASTTGLRKHSVECRAYLRDHHCGSCRACWSPNVKNVSYLLNAGLRHRTGRPVPTQHRLAVIQ